MGFSGVGPTNDKADQPGHPEDHQVIRAARDAIKLASEDIVGSGWRHGGPVPASRCVKPLLRFRASSIARLPSAAEMLDTDSLLVLAKKPCSRPRRRYTSNCSRSLSV